MLSKAELFCRVAEKHDECTDAKIIDIGNSSAIVNINLNVQMPFQYRVDGQSPNGVYNNETISVLLLEQFPWLPPFFSLRMNFPRNLPHLQPGKITEPPEPCLIDGSIREYFFQFGLAEVGVFHLIDQLAIWLRKAATSSLIDYSQGWEPTLRQNLEHTAYLDVEGFQNSVERSAGFKIYGSEYFRIGAASATLDEELCILLETRQEQVPLRQSNTDKQLSVTYNDNGNAMMGNTVVGLVWAGKDASGNPIISDRYSAETVTNIGELKARAETLKCDVPLTQFLQSLERYFNGLNYNFPIPVGVILGIRRPCNVMGFNSDVELLPYIFELNAKSNRRSLFLSGDSEPVKPVQAVAEITQTFLLGISEAPDIPALTMLGAGSVGSKLALHLAKSGSTMSSIADKGYFRPHNSARHGLIKKKGYGNKAKVLSNEIEHLGQSPGIYTEDLIYGLKSKKEISKILPKEAQFAINSTASLAVREALTDIDLKVSSHRQIETALFGRGQGAFILVEGCERNPTLCDLVGELYANESQVGQRDLLFDEKFGLQQMQIGLGCSSYTMPMSDARVSSMTGSLAEEIQRITANPPKYGEIVVALKDNDSPTTKWTRNEVKPFLNSKIEGLAGWSIRVSMSVFERMKKDQAQYPGLETGGVMMGLCSARLQTITVVDLLAAPIDSRRSATEFVLGVDGLRKDIEKGFIDSGRSLVDVGTWHTHLSDSGPSSLDRETAANLAKDRTPPSCLFIVTPNRQYAYMACKNG